MGGNPDSGEGKTDFQKSKADMEGKYSCGVRWGAPLRTRDKETSYGRARQRAESREKIKQNSPGRQLRGT